jgi:hypothetical protein
MVGLLQGEFLKRREGRAILRKDMLMREMSNAVMRHDCNMEFIGGSRAGLQDSGVHFPSFLCA